MKKIKTILVLFGCLLSILQVNIINADEQKKLLIIDDISTWEYDNDKWYKYNNTDYYNYSFSTYVNNNYYGIYKIEKDDGYNLYNNQNQLVSYNGDLVAISSNFNIKLKPYVLAMINNEDLTEINTILNGSFITTDFTINQSVVIDLDNNGIDDIIVNVSNLDEENEQDFFFNLMYIKLNNQEPQVLIKDNVEERDVLATPTYGIKYIITGNNSYDSIIVQDRYFSYTRKTTNTLYEWQNGIYSKTTINNARKNDDKPKTDNKTDYTMYIFYGILLIVFLLGYLVFNIIKKKNDNMDD